MPAQVLVKELGLGAPFMHVQDEGTATLQPERVFRVVALRASTVIVENGIGVRSSMSKNTRVAPLAATAWAAQPAAKATAEQEKAAG
jgi:hypothetical protein